MKKNIIFTAMLLSFSAIGMSANANAAEIQFSGTVTAASCSLENDANLLMPLAPIGVKSVTEAGQENGVTSLSAKVICENSVEKSGMVTMAMLPNQGSFEGKVLKNQQLGDDAAKGVGIVVMGDDKKPMDFSQGAAAKITAPMTNGVANITISATYAKDGSGAIEPGVVAAVLPFVMTYE